MGTFGGLATILILLSCLMGDAASFMTLEEERELYSNAGPFGSLEDLNMATRPMVKCNEHITSPLSCHNFARYNINKLNQQIRSCLNASYTYTSMAKFFSRDDKAYEGFSVLFNDLSSRETHNAKSLINYVVKRGGRVHFKPINDPKASWYSPTDAVCDALGLEHELNDAFLTMHQTAQSKNDPHLQMYIENHFLDQKVNNIRRLSDFVTILKRINSYPFAVHIFDEELKAGIRAMPVDEHEERHKQL